MLRPSTVSGLALVALLLTGCSGGSKATGTGTVATNAGSPGDQAEQLLAARYAVGPRIPHGSGPLGTDIGNTAHTDFTGSGSLVFAFACTGKSVVSISIADRGHKLTSLAGKHQCGAGIFTRSVPYTATSRISFHGSTESVSPGGFAYAYLPEVGSRGGW